MIKLMLGKYFKNAGQEVHVVVNSLVLLFCVVLVLAVLVLLLKHEKLKMAMYSYVSQASIVARQKYVGADATEDAKMLATTLASVPAATPLWTDKADMQKLVTALASQSGRNIVVEDVHQVILADSIPANVGKVYSYGGGMDVQTMRDSNPRRFIETSMDYPDGVDEVVVAVKSNGAVVGAVIMSTSHIFDN